MKRKTDRDIVDRARPCTSTISYNKEVVPVDSAFNAQPDLHFWHSHTLRIGIGINILSVINYNNQESKFLSEKQIHISLRKTHHDGTRN